MCGIAGFVGLASSGAAERVEAMLARMVHRGPDAGAVTAGPGWALGARRLAVIDLATGDQPVASEGGRVHAVLNGEIYNYRDLREWLLARGHELHSVGDTEVLPHLWEELGPALVPRLHGMFACAVMDEAHGALLLARDRMGKKPLYWTRVAQGLAFASELKALRAAVPELGAVDEGALRSYLAWGFVPEGECFVRQVHKLPPGHLLRLDTGSGEVHVEPYWRLILRPDPALSFRQAQDRILEALDEAVRLRLQADVPLAVFLSGGLDSGVVTALAARHQHGLRALTVELAGEPSELPLARATAARAGVELLPLVVDPEEGRTLLPRLAEVFDEPLADASGIPTYLIAREARRHVTVVLNGDGGDECLAGYRRFLAARLLGVPGSRVWAPAAAALAGGVGLLPRHWAARLREGLRNTDAYQAWGPVKLNAGEVEALLPGCGPPSSAPGTREVRVDCPRHDAVNAMRALELGFFLPGDLLVKMDRATMACSLEARSPFLDQRVVELAATMPPRLLIRGWRTKAVLRAATRGVLPRAVRVAPKRGFEVPVARWLTGPWHEEVRRVLEDPTARVRGIVSPGGLARWCSWRAFPDPERAARAVYTLLTLEHWLERWA